jgi:hypothetical protein
MVYEEIRWCGYCDNECKNLYEYADMKVCKSCLDVYNKS